MASGDGGISGALTSILSVLRVGRRLPGRRPAEPEIERPERGVVDERSTIHRWTALLGT